MWAWNAALALVCGDPVVWKPSEKTPLTALACQAILARALTRFGDAPVGLSQVLIGAGEIGTVMVEHKHVALISATGSTRMGRIVGPRVAARFGRSILELGGNNAGIVCPSADLDMALRAIAFGAIGTAGQRCTTLRRLFVHDSVYDALVPRLKAAYGSVSIGNPLETDALVGPLIDRAAYEGMQKALAAAGAKGGSIVGGARVAIGGEAAVYVQPALVEMPAQTGPVLEETFAPILYVMRYSDFDDAIAQHNVPLRRRLGLRHCQRQHWHLGRRDRRRFRRREGNRWRARKRLGRVEGLHASRHQHHQLLPLPAAGAGRGVRGRLMASVMTEGGFTAGLNHATKQRVRAGRLHLSEVVRL